MKVPGHQVIRQGGPRVGLALEVEGYEIRDCIHVVTCEGVEQWWLARWPVEGTVSANVLKHGAGVLHIDACRLSWFGAVPEIGTPGWGGPAKKLSTVPGGLGATVDRVGPNKHGRWPPNLVFLHAEGCKRVGEKRVTSSTKPVVQKSASTGRVFNGVGNHQGKLSGHYADPDGKETVPEYVCVPGCPVATLDEMSGFLTTGAMRASVQRGKLGGHGVYGSSDGSGEGRAVEASSGGASRFFPCFESKEELVEWISRLVGSQVGVE